MGAENRLAAQYFLGAPDPHCGLPFVTVLPRRIAHWYARRKGQGSYRNYIYSYRGYRKLLRRAGFQDIRVFNALPSYNHPRYLVPPEEPMFSYFVRNFPVIAPPSGAIKRAIHHVLMATRLLHYLQRSFVIFARAR